MDKDHMNDHPQEADTLSGQGQDAVFAFLADPVTHGMAGNIPHIDTHGAAVFLAGADVYKVKHAVRFPFLDYSTIEKRRQACEREVEINRPHAPDLYLGAMPITRRDDGALALGGSGRAVEWAVHMRRFDETQTFDRLASDGGLSNALLRDLTQAVVASHARAPRADGVAAAASLRSYIEANDTAFGAEPSLFPGIEAQALTDASRRLFDRLRPLLEARGASGYVRRCHGDLHLRNIALIDGKPVLFDAIEFSDAIATGDVLYDLAFLLMDLWERGLHEAANLVLNRYLWASGAESHYTALAAMPLFLSLRAAIRAKVTAASLRYLRAAEHETARCEASRYFELACGFVKPCPASLVAIGGLSGSGKTTLAMSLAHHLGRPPGAVVLRSDVERKAMLGVAETEHLPDSAYDATATERVYARLDRRAGLALAAGQSVILDAVHAKDGERQAAEAVARAQHVPFQGLWLDVPEGLRVERVGHRRDDASDSDAAVVRRQTGYETGGITWRRMAASEGAARVLAQALPLC